MDPGGQEYDKELLTICTDPVCKILAPWTTGELLITLGENNTMNLLSKMIQMLKSYSTCMTIHFKVIVVHAHLFKLQGTT